MPDILPLKLRLEYTARHPFYKLAPSSVLDQEELIYM